MKSKFDRHIDAVIRRSFRLIPICIVMGAFIGWIIELPPGALGFEGLLIGGIVGSLVPAFVIIAALWADLCFNPIRR